MYGGDLQLTIELYHKSALKDELLGFCQMSVLRFLKNPYVVYTESLPIFEKGRQDSTSKLKLEFSFEEARTGMFVVTLYEAQGLRQLDPLGQQDPYVQLSLGDRYKKRGKSVKGGGVEPYFTEEQILMWVDKVTLSLTLILTLTLSLTLTRTLTRRIGSMTFVLSCLMSISGRKRL